MKCLILVAVLIAVCECHPSTRCDSDRFETDILVCHKELLVETEKFSEDDGTEDFAEAVCRGLDKIRNCYEDVALKTGCHVDRIKEIEEAVEIGKEWLLLNKRIQC